MVPSEKDKFTVSDSQETFKIAHLCALTTEELKMFAPYLADSTFLPVYRAVKKFKEGLASFEELLVLS